MLCLNNFIDHNDNSENLSLNNSETLIYNDSDLLSNSSQTSQNTVKYSELKILSLNAGGLRSKIHNPEFEETIQNYDIVCIQETRFDLFDTIDVSGFKCLPFKTRTCAKIRSGGIAILVKEHLIDKVKIKKKNDGKTFCI